MYALARNVDSYAVCQKMQKRKRGREALCAGTDDNLRIYIKDLSLRDKTEEIIRKNTLISTLAYKIIVIDHFPISESGKIMYAKLLE